MNNAFELGPLPDVELADLLVSYIAETEQRDSTLKLIDQLQTNDMEGLRLYDIETLSAVLDSTNRTAIHIATTAGHVSLVEYLLRINPFFLNQVDSKNRTPLMLAAMLGHTQIVRLLVEKKALLEIKVNDLSDHLSHGLTALALANQQGHGEMVDFLIQSGSFFRCKSHERALELIEKYQHIAPIILKNLSIRQLLLYRTPLDIDDEGLPAPYEMVDDVDYQYKIAGRRPSFCAEINWKTNQVTLFKAVQSIGKGTFGEVRRFCSSDGRVIAVKSFEPIRGKPSCQPQEIQLEASIMQKAYGEEVLCKPFFFKPQTDKRIKARVIMPFIPGEQAHIVLSTISSIDEAARFIRMLTEALISLHQKGVIHGDIKENNIVIERHMSEYRITFVDFGNSYLVTDQCAVITIEEANYWAPERTKNNMMHLAPHTNQDVFSFGDMLSRMMRLDYPQAQSLLNAYPSIMHFIQGALNIMPGRRPTLQSFYDALSAECHSIESQKIPVCV